MIRTIVILAGLVAMVSCATLAPPGVPTQDPAAVMTTVDGCKDDNNTDCWSRPNDNCEGIYEAWSHVHCPLRCGLCPGILPPCEDFLDYCDQFELSTCTLPSYQVWARKNCRKHCNLCYVPTPAPGGTTPAGPAVTDSPPAGQTTQAGGPMTPPGPDVTTDAGARDNTTVLDVNATHAVPVVTPHAIPGTVARGQQETIIIQGPGSQKPGMCLYHGQEYKMGSRWNDGCNYECSCMDSVQNRVVCSERCTRWETTAELTGCKMVKEENECCMRLECGVNV